MITSALQIVIALLLGLPLGPAAIAFVKQGGPQWRDTLRQNEKDMESRTSLPGEAKALCGAVAYRRRDVGFAVADLLRKGAI